MPSYDYRCNKCGYTQTLTVSISNPPAAPTCLECDLPMVRHYNAPGITFKGTGWGKDK